MGIGGISVGSLLIILVIVLLLFGTKKLRNIGGDLGGAIKGFRSAMNEGDKDAEGKDEQDAESARLESRAEDKPTETKSKSGDRSSS
ncbi:twin-arginine translocase TatA/TatE family subunit [Methylonatrum kenyense]|uniref:twin-arginine translocase TatA/TatE family subunit n=1 Tax=Methylonatrum kenyense TaxID=455253 RepID=UPI0020C02E02|nr:twin-arginine translocase TatA/TatE family subunit [Methylonatrum kenyense]MCK8515333.1 twin-arginine translocase TatA/TatE family subunit [Methylonatrum kenyense]